MTREIRENLRAADLNLEEVNRILGRLQDRLDELEGRRGTPIFYAAPDLQGNKITNAAQGASAGEVLTANLETTDLEISGGNLRVKLAETQGVQRTTDGIAVRVDSAYGLTVNEVAGIRALVQDNGGILIDTDEGLKADPTNIDHGSLGGLADDDHSQYLNTTRHDTPDRHGDAVIFTTAMTEYSGSSTVSGWSSPTVEIWYKKLGKLVFVCFDIAGTSDSVYATFTVPYTAKTSGLDFVGSCEGVDAGTACLTNFRLPANSSTVSVYKANIDANWTASGTKAVRGQFFYEAAS